MKIKLRAIFVIVVLILLSGSIAIFADVPSIKATKSESGKSSVSNLILRESEITNEAEYKEFVRKNEGINQASSSKSAPQISRTEKTSASSSNKSFGRSRNP